MNGAGLGHQLRARRLTTPAQDQDQNVLAAAEQEGAEHDRDAELDEQSEDVSFAPPVEYAAPGTPPPLATKSFSSTTNAPCWHRAAAVDIASDTEIE